jgi:hypothetical protein
MSVLATLSSSLAALVVVAVIVWLGGALLVAFWGQARGYPFWPLLICAAIIGWPIVLLVVVIAAGPDGRQCPACGNGVRGGVTICPHCEHDFAEAAAR